jgi:tRNA-dihydrouridine synthase
LQTEIPRPISCKIRLSETTQQAIAFIEGMMNAGNGVNAIAIHARRVGHDAQLTADFETLIEVLGLLRPKYPTFSFLINGDFYDQQEQDDFMTKTKALGVLLGCPALYNTVSFDHYQNLWSSRRKLSKNICNIPCGMICTIRIPNMLFVK